MYIELGVVKLHKRFELLLAELADFQFPLNGLPRVVQQHGENAGHREHASDDGTAIRGEVAK